MSDKRIQLPPNGSIVRAANSAMAWRGILSIFVLMMCLSGCATTHAQRQASHKELSKQLMAVSVCPGVPISATQGQKLDPKDKARIEEGLRKHMNLPSSTVLSGWQISGEFDIEAVAEAMNDDDTQRVIYEKWRFRVGQDGILILSRTPR